MKNTGWLLSLLTMVAWNSFAMTVSLENETTAHVVLNATALKVTQTQSGAWRLQQLVEGRADELGAAQVLAEEFDGGFRPDNVKLVLSENILSGAGCTQLVISDQSICVQDETGRQLTCITGVECGASVKVTGSLQPEERLYGTGERFDQVNQRGKSARIWAVDKWCSTKGNSYVPIPIMISSSGYGIYMNRFEFSEFDLGKTGKNQWKVTLRNAPIDLYVFPGTPAEVVDQYTALTGRSPMPADWTFGIHVCRHVKDEEFANPKGIRTMMQKMEENDLPWHSVIIEGWDAYNPETYADLKIITDEVHESGHKVLAYYAAGRIWQFLSAKPFEFYFDALGAKKEYFVADATGNIAHPETAGFNPLDAPGKHIGSFVDVTDPEAWKWWIETVSDPLHKEIGIDGAKIDFCEQFPEIEGMQFHNGASEKGMHHLYPVLYNTKMYRYYQTVRPEGGMCFSRGGGIGAQRYPMMWAGDQKREWPSLQHILRGSLSAGLSGIPFMGHDAAGYIPAGKKRKDDVEKDVFARGVQMAAFGPSMQTHGRVTRPYDFDPETVSIYRLYSKIHVALMPYLIEQGKVATQTGLPIMRHMILEFPDDPRVYDLEDQFMLGDAFLVAPILTPENVRSLYLPAGTWTPLFGGKTIEGPVMLNEVEVPRSEIAVYVRQMDRPVVKDVVAEIRKLVK